MNYVYFVSYFYKDGQGNSQITQDCEMNSLDLIKSAQKIISNDNVEFDNCVITNFILLRTEEKQD